MRLERGEAAVNALQVHGQGWGVRLAVEGQVGGCEEALALGAAMNALYVSWQGWRVVVADEDAVRPAVNIASMKQG